MQTFIDKTPKGRDEALFFSSSSRSVSPSPSSNVSSPMSTSPSPSLPSPRAAQTWVGEIRMASPPLRASSPPNALSATVVSPKPVLDKQPSALLRVTTFLDKSQEGHDKLAALPPTHKSTPSGSSGSSSSLLRMFQRGRAESDKTESAGHRKKQHSHSSNEGSGDEGPDEDDGGGGAKLKKPRHLRSPPGGATGPQRAALLQSKMNTQYDHARVAEGTTAALDTLKAHVEHKVARFDAHSHAEKQELEEAKLNLLNQFRGFASFEIYTGKDAVARFERQYELMDDLGRGSFACVVRVRRKEVPHKQFALKIVDKSKLNSGNKARDEVELLRTMDHPFIIRLEDAFETADHLCCVLELMLGGTGNDILVERNLNSLMSSRRRPISEKCAQFYAAQVVLAMEYLHSRNIVHRDLKPDNCFIDHEGHLRVADLGIARQLHADRPAALTETIGQEGFKAPEMLTGEGYGLSVDYWNLGILLYTFLAMRHPFHSWLGNTDKMALTTDYEPLKDNSEEVNDLIARLLEKDYTKRLGVSGIHEVKRHPFFASVDWEAMLLKRVPPPVHVGSTRSDHAASHLKVKQLDDDETPRYPTFADALKHFHDTDPTTVTL